MRAGPPWILVATLAASLAHGGEPESQLGIVKAYLEAREATMQATAGPADVERVLSLCAPSVVYEHPRVGARRVGVNALRSGMLAFLGASRKASIRITAQLQGRDVVVVQTEVAFEGRDGTTWVPVERSQTWLFELAGSKIRRIIEYW
jgi:SnoaL-like domain